MANSINNKNGIKNEIRFVDLFAGLGGIRIGFEQAFQEAGYETKCVLTSEIKASAINALTNNFERHSIKGDITAIDASDIPDFDIMLAGFPCQAFSVAGKQKGFLDTRGTLFFELERILREKNPYGFILENVEGLVVHDQGKTFKTIMHVLEKDLRYNVTWKILDSQKFGLPQKRNRVYIVGTRKENVTLSSYETVNRVFGDIMEHGLPTVDSPFTRQLFAKYRAEELYGKAIKDKRGGISNIHSWDVELRGHVSDDEKELLNVIMRERRKKHWAGEIGIDWMDGMPLTLLQIQSFHNVENLEEMLLGLTDKGYLVFEHPKKKVVTTDSNGNEAFDRIPDTTKPRGYNIVTGKLSFDFTHILSPKTATPTIVAMDMSSLGVIDNNGLRHLTLREGLRLFGYPDWYSLDSFNKTDKGRNIGYDLLGNTVCVPVIKFVASRLAENVRRNFK